MGNHELMKTSVVISRLTIRIAPFMPSICSRPICIRGAPNYTASVLVPVHDDGILDQVVLYTKYQYTMYGIPLLDP